MNVEYQELINVTLWQKGSKWHSLPKFVCVCLCNFLIINSGLYALSLNSYFQLCCDLLEKSYFCSIANNPPCLAWPVRVVVICLKNRTFAVSQTSNIGTGKLYIRLWFAWKIVLLQYRKQPRRAWVEERLSCDLLEKSYFCSIANNSTHSSLEELIVVICLKNRTFAVSQTTPSVCNIVPLRLWFAWKIVLLQYRKQRKLKNPDSGKCCDLLEKSYFCSIANNR